MVLLPVATLVTLNAHYLTVKLLVALLIPVDFVIEFVAGAPQLLINLPILVWRQSLLLLSELLRGLVSYFLQCRVLLHFSIQFLLHSFHLFGLGRSSTLPFSRCVRTPTCRVVTAHGVGHPGLHRVDFHYRWDPVLVKILKIVSLSIKHRAQSFLALDLVN